MPKIIACGCSCTYGHGLPDITIPGKSIPDITKGPSKLAWPQLLADKLNYDCINLSLPAAPNKYIAYKLTELDDIQPDDIIIFMWTFIFRSCILPSITPETKITDSTDILFLRKEQHTFNKAKKASDQWAAWQARHSNEYDLVCENMSWVGMGNNYAKTKTKNVFNYTINDKIMLPFQNKFGVEIVDDISNYAFKQPLALDNAHPGLETHNKIANQIFAKIKEVENEH